VIREKMPIANILNMELINELIQFALEEFFVVQW